MKNFKPYQKVVFSIEHLTRSSGLSFEDLKRVAPDGQIWPNEKEVVTIVGPCTARPGWWIIKEYSKSRDGNTQIFCDVVLFPLEEIHQKYTDSIIQKIESEQKIEILEPVLS